MTLAQTLETTRVVQLDVDEARLPQVFEQLSMLTGIRFVLSDAAKEKAAKVRIKSLQLSDVKLTDVLGLLARANQLQWQTVDDHVRIVDPQVANRDPSGAVVQIHSVADLVPVVGKEPLLERIDEGVDDDLWNGYEHTIRFQGDGALVVRAIPAAQEQVAAALDKLRGEQPVRLRFYDVKDLPNQEAMASVVASQYIDRSRGHTVTLQKGILIVRAPTHALARIAEYLDTRRREKAGR